MSGERGASKQYAPPPPLFASMQSKGDRDTGIRMYGIQTTCGCKLHKYDDQRTYLRFRPERRCLAESRVVNPRSL